MRKYIITVDVCTEQWAKDIEIYLITADNQDKAVKDILSKGIVKADGDPIEKDNILDIKDITDLEYGMVGAFNYYE